MIDINNKFNNAVKTPCDINEHLQYLCILSLDCQTILECGVRSVVSSWAFLKGLVQNNKKSKHLSCCDLSRDSAIDDLSIACKQNDIQFTFFEQNDLTIPMTHYDMIFIDTWHIYGHLKRELEKMHSYANKYIVMHDTEVDKIHGESIRMKHNIEQECIESEYPKEEITCGLQKAIDEFLQNHPEWKIKDQFIHSNGLTTLERI
jgi:cephalosporin hydroxylase